MNKEDEQAQNKITFSYEKSNYFRVIHVDGIIGGPGPKGEIHVSFFNERRPIPKSITHEVKAEGIVGEEISRTGRDSLFREVECCAILDLKTAEAFHEWLGNNIKKIKGIEEEKNDESE